MGSGWSNSHPCQPSDPTQLSCTLESISLWLGDIKKAIDIYVQDDDWSRFVAKCSLTDLLQSTPQLPSPWQEFAKVPIAHCTPTSMSGHLLAVGGYSMTGPTNKIHQYFPETNTWEVISQMPTARCHCLVAMLPGSKLMVVGGGVRTPYDYTDLVEIGTLH